MSMTTTVKLLYYMFIFRKMKARMLPQGKSWNEHEHYSQTSLLHVYFPQDESTGANTREVLK